MDYSVCRYKPGDEEDIAKLLNEVFRGWPKFDLQCSPLDHWRWKFIDNPPKVTVVFLAVSDGKIIGCSHGLPQRLKIGEQILLSCQGADAATSSDFGGMGVHSKIKLHKVAFMKNAGIHFYFSVSANPILIDKNKREKHHALPFTLEKLLRIRDIDLHLKMVSSEKDLFKKYGFHTLKIINRFKRAKRASNKIHHDFKIAEINIFDDRIDKFWSQVSTKYKFIVQRDRDYLNWRYCDPRGGNYIVKVAEAESRILGFIILRINRYDVKYPVGYIVDLLALPDRLDVISELAISAVDYFDNENINKIQVNALKNSSTESMFQRMGFINDTMIPFINYPPEFRNDALDGLNKNDVNNIHFVYGDYDYI
jgi:hypothetical protein